MDFGNKIVLVTGASRGIGRAVAIRFARSNAKVAVHYHRNKQAGEETLRAMPGESHGLFQGDLADPLSIEGLVRSVIEQMGRIDILVNNAGIFEEHPLAKCDFVTWKQAWKKTLATNLVGPANLCYLVSRHMIENGGGRIVNVSSRGAFRGEPDAPAYGASKAGLNAMSQSLAKALAPHNIFVSVVAPGWVDTDMAADSLQGPEGEEIRRQSPLNRVATADEVAHAVLFLASDGCDFLTGSILDVNGASYLRS